MQFPQVLGAVPDAMIAVDKSGVIKYANEAACALFGYDQLEDINLEELIPRSQRAGHELERAEYLKRPRRRSMGAGRNIYGLRRNGSTFRADISLSPYQNDEALTLAVVRDIDERHVARRKGYARAQRFFRTRGPGSPVLFALAMALIIIVNVITVKNFEADQRARDTQATLAIQAGCRRSSADRVHQINALRALERNTARQSVRVLKRSILPLDRHVAVSLALRLASPTDRATAYQANFRCDKTYPLPK